MTSNITYDIIAKLLNLCNVSIQKIREGLLRDAGCSVRIRIRNTQGKRSSIVARHYIHHCPHRFNIDKMLVNPGRSSFRTIRDHRL